MTRMWMVDPRIMCRQHLLGEHAEVHMIAANIGLGRSIEGYIRANAIEPKSIRSRHDELVAEMLQRNMKHMSPLDFSTLNYPNITVDRDASLQMLIGRCPRCAKRLAVLGNEPGVIIMDPAKT
jgi:hypothetical protein